MYPIKDLYPENVKDSHNSIIARQTTSKKWARNQNTHFIKKDVRRIDGT